MSHFFCCYPKCIFSCVLLGFFSSQVFLFLTLLHFLHLLLSPTLSLTPPLYIFVCLPISLSLSHTHTHSISISLSLSLSSFFITMLIKLFISIQLFFLWFSPIFVPLVLSHSVSKNYYELNQPEQSCDTILILLHVQNIKKYNSL